MRNISWEKLIFESNNNFCRRCILRGIDIKRRVRKVALTSLFNVYPQRMFNNALYEIQKGITVIGEVINNL